MSINDFSNKFSNQIKSSSNKLIGSSPRSSEGLYKTSSNTSDNLFSDKKSSRPRILSIPSKKNSSIPFSSDSYSDSASASSLLDSGKDFITNSASIATTTIPVITQSGSSFFRYLLIFLIIGFLFLNLFLYLTKPVNTSILDMYNPLLKQLGFDVKEPTPPKKVKVNTKENKSAVNKLEKAIDDKKIVNKIDGKNIEEQQHEEQGQSTKRKPFIPEPDVSASRLQANKPTSKQGYCYIGEDRGFRSCIEVGKGDVCMSGDIFPTKDICINPNLRE
jgi:hypothetical protein